jgi:diguanylate cyclase (GGDEF)-like protein
VTEEIGKNLLDCLAVPVIICKACYDKNETINDFTVVYVNAQYSKQTHNFAKVGDTYSSSLKTLLPQDVDWFQICGNILRTGGIFEDEYLSPRLNTWFHLILQKYSSDFCIFILSNVTAQKIQQQELTFLENYDIKTGLPNSICFQNVLDESIEKVAESKGSCGLLFIDIDNLRVINDLSGRDEGNEVIRQGAKILFSMESGAVHPFRMEGDEFAVIVSLNMQDKTITDFCETIFSEFTRNDIHISIGAAVYPEHGNDSRSLVKAADIALDFVKNNGKGNYILFKPSMYTNFIDHIQLQKRILSGIEKNQFALYFQPQFYLEDHTLRGFEALIRWHDDIYGWRDPLSFIPVAEESNIIQILGNWILDEACKTLGIWQQRNEFSGILAVNISPVQLKAPNFANTVMKCVSKYAIQPDTLELEITESIFISDIGRITSLLGELRSFGVRISLDDFGTGYSSLRYLGNIPVDTLKFDKSFIDNITQENVLGTEIIASLIPVTKRACIETIAEGVEHDEQLTALGTIGCTCVQGFLWGKPMSLEKCELFIHGDISALEYLI